MTKTLSVTILAGESLSGAAALTGSGALAMVLTPSNWTGACLGFQLSDDNVAFFDLFDQGGEVLLPAPAGAAIPVDPALSAPYLRLRAGSRDNPSTQAADCVFTFAVV